MPADPGQQPEVKPNPDPTAATNAAVDRAMTSERDYVNGKFEALVTRLDGNDVATDLRLKAIDDIPARIDEKVSHLEQVMDARLVAMDGRLDMFDGLRLELKADSKTSIDAALLAQKEQATLQDQANQKAIDKQNDQNEKAMDKLTELFRAEMSALRTEISGQSREMTALDTRVTKTEAAKEGGHAAVQESRESSTFNRGLVTFGISLLAAAILIVGIIIAAKSGTPTVP